MSNLFFSENEGPTIAEIEKLPQDWTAPDLKKLPKMLEGLIAFDLETQDLGLNEGQGPGWAWQGGGRVVGYSFSADNWSGYLPVAHESGGNVNAKEARAIINRWMSDPKQKKVGANVLYDLGWSKRDGVTIKGPVYDVQWAEALLDEHRWGYSLDGLAKSYLNEGKDETLLRSAASAWGVDAKSGLWRLPAAFVGPYAEADADRTRRVFLAQLPKLEAANLMKIFELECSLLPLYLSMRWRGVRIDVSKAEQLKERWVKEVKQKVDEIKRRTGVAVDLWAAGSLAQAFDKEGIKYPYTEKTKAPSITGAWLTLQNHWLTDLVSSARELDKLGGTFIDGTILGHLHNGRIHCEFHPLRGEDGGTISGRLSSSNPNLQQIPTRTEQGKLIRTCFLPEQEEKWYSLDYSQQEPRLTIHYAASVKRGGMNLPGALEAVEKYRVNPKMSYHQMVADETGLSYKRAKILNLALTYGRGAQSTAYELKCSLEEAKTYIEQYHARVPFVKGLDNILRDQVEKNGEIKTLLGRHCRFPYWEPADFEKARECTPQPLWKAKKLWPGQKLRIAWMHKKMNRLIQGSAADQTKKAMQDLMNAGFTDNVLVQVHDEMGMSLPNEKMAKEAAHIMEHAVELKVPSVVDIEAGPSWGDAFEVKD